MADMSVEEAIRHQELIREVLLNATGHNTNQTDSLTIVLDELKRLRAKEGEV